MKFNKQNTMKLINALMIAFAVFISVPAMSQDKDEPSNDQKEMVEALKRAFITERLNLSVAEAEKFWPVFNSYRDEIDELRATVDRKPNKDMTDKEAEDMMYAMLDAKSKEIDIQKKYIQKLKSAIPPRKIAQLFRLEKDFKEKVISNMKERRMGRKGGM